MLDTLRADLGAVGLSEKEANIYLALLQLGSATPNVLAQKTDVNRSTAYLTLASLQKRGLVSSVEARGKQCFVAEPPDRLAKLVDESVRRVEEGRMKILEAMPALSALFQVADSAPRVRFFEGAEALQAAREEMWATRAPICEVYAADEETLRVSALKEDERLKLTERMRGGRLLIAVKPGVTLPKFHPEAFEVRFLDYARCPFRGSLTLADKKVCIVTTHAEGMGVLIDNPELTTVFRALFESAWHSSIRPK
jgi:sugar-specific transcriptional regulator TrmB